MAKITYGISADNVEYTCASPLSVGMYKVANVNKFAKKHCICVEKNIGKEDHTL